MRLVWNMALNVFVVMSKTFMLRRLHPHLRIQPKSNGTPEVLCLRLSQTAIATSPARACHNTIAVLEIC
jgi:hypothetical protein